MRSDRTSFLRSRAESFFDVVQDAVFEKRPQVRGRNLHVGRRDEAFRVEPTILGGAFLPRGIISSGDAEAGVVVSIQRSAAAATSGSDVARPKPE